MAHLLFLRAQIAVVVGLLLGLSASARPCRTFLISSYTFSVPSDNPSEDPSTATLTTFTEIRSFLPLRFSSDAATAAAKPSFPVEIFFDRPARPLVDKSAVEIDRHPRPATPFGFSADDFSSLRDRTKDIVSVVVALLFGVSCGALTAATMYLVWFMFSSRYDYRYDDYLDGDDEEEEKIESPKKLGYVKIPAAEGDLPAKEAV